LRIAILTNEYPPFIFGGVGTFCQNLAEALAEEGLDVTVIAGSPEKTPKRTRQEGQRPIEILWVPRGPFPPRHVWFQLRNADLIRRELSRCDIAHGQDAAVFPLLQFCRRSGPKLPWVVTLHTSPYEELRLTLASTLRGASINDFTSFVAGFPLWDLAVRGHASAADRLVCVSDSLRERLCIEYGLDRKRVSVVHACINKAELETVLPERGPTPAERIQLYCAGRLYYRKGPLHLLRIARCLIDELGVTRFDLQVFGSGPMEQLMRRYIARFGLERNVRLRGHVSRRTLLTNLASSDIMCFPSLYEACPLAMIEAMALRKPVVTFDLPFSREILGENCDMLVAEDTLDYARKLVHLIDSPADRAQLGRILGARAEIFDSSRTAASYRAIYEDLITRSR